MSEPQTHDEWHDLAMCHWKSCRCDHPAALPGDELERLLRGRHLDPHAVLGPHKTESGLVIRALRPYATAVHIHAPGHPAHETELTPLADGLFGAVLPAGEIADYGIVAQYARDTHGTADGYRLRPSLSHAELASFAEGTHQRLWEMLGAHVTEIDGMQGVRFAVWAPHADGVTVTGDFDCWSGRTYPLRLLDAGVWEVFVPAAQPGQLYKFRVHTGDGRVIEKADPVAFATEVPPANASRITFSRHLWADSIWMRSRNTRPFTGISVYEVHAGSWRKHEDGSPLTYRELAETLIPYVLDAGFTHVEFLPLTEHPFGGSWGYQVTSYFAPTARYGSPDDLKYLIDQLHRAGIGVIIDWVPAHFPRDDWALARFDGTPLFEHPDPQRGEHPEWGTYIFDWSKPEVRNFLVASALHWLTEFHADGLRVDAVASMLYLDYARPPGGWQPNELGGRENLDAVSFLQQLNTAVERHAPGAFTVAEDSSTWPGVTRPVALGGLGFTYKWNMRWMNDSLRYLSRPFTERSLHHSELTYSLLYAWSEHYMLPISHDEVVHGKGSLWSRMSGNETQRAAGLRTFLAYMWAHPGKKLLFMGQEFGQSTEWSESRGLDWYEAAGTRHRVHAGVADFVRELNRLYRSRPALWDLDDSTDGFSWIDPSDSMNCVVSFLRYSKDGAVLACVANFSDKTAAHYRLGLPYTGTWRSILDTDATEFGGSTSLSHRPIVAKTEPWQGRPASAILTIAPLAALWLEPS